VVSAVLGVYVGLNTELLGDKVPVPKVVHVPDPVEAYPFNTTIGLFLQTEILAPAFTTGAGLKLTRMVLVVALQLPLEVVLSVITTLPAVVSAGLAEYVAFIVVVEGAKLPVPDVNHFAPPAPVNEPVNMAMALFAQTV
jgi:hypothetical protein